MAKECIDEFLPAMLERVLYGDLCLLWEGSSHAAVAAYAPNGRITAWLHQSLETQVTARAAIVRTDKWFRQACAKMRQRERTLRGRGQYRSGRGSQRRQRPMRIAVGVAVTLILAP